MVIDRTWCVMTTVVLWQLCAANKWRFPDENVAASLRIDNKIKFTDRDDTHSANDPNTRVQSDEIPFQQPTDTEGFYNRPPGAGQYPVRTENYQGSNRLQERLQFPDRRLFQSDGTLDSLQYCKCVSTPECTPHHKSENACGSERILCCYKKPNQQNQHGSEFFNEVEDERPALLPNRENIARPFPPPPETELNTGFGAGHAHEAGILGALDRPDSLIGQNVAVANDNRRVLVGPEGPTGVIGPAQQNSAVLVGPGGPTGVIGPMNSRRDVRPHGQNIYQSQSAQRGILVGPGGPTGIIGPAYDGRPILVGPGGPTGIIGPNRPGNRGVLFGPGGPTGIIGPGYNRQPRPRYFARPQESAFGLEPDQQVLVGPGGPTGQVGPQYYGK